MTSTFFLHFLPLSAYLPFFILSLKHFAGKTGNQFKGTLDSSGILMKFFKSNF